MCKSVRQQGHSVRLSQTEAFLSTTCCDIGQVYLLKEWIRHLHQKKGKDLQERWHIHLISCIGGIFCLMFDVDTGISNELDLMRLRTKLLSNGLPRLTTS